MKSSSWEPSLPISNDNWHRIESRGEMDHSSHHPKYANPAATHSEKRHRYAEAVDISEPVENEEGLRQEINTTKGMITRLGVVNLAAIEEYEEIKEKYEFMSAQAEDLENAKRELKSVIEEMTNEMKTLFKENFIIFWNKKDFFC